MSAVESGVDRQTNRRRWFWGISALGLIAVLAFFRHVLTPFILAVVVAYVFAPVVDRLEQVKIGKKPTPRWIAVVTLYLGLLAVLAGTVAIGIPVFGREVQKLSRDLPSYVVQARSLWIPRVEGWVGGVFASLGMPLSSGSGGAAEVDVEPPPNDGPRPESPLVDGAPDDTAVQPAIRIVPNGSGFDVVLPQDGLVVERQGEGVVHVRPGHSGPQERPTAHEFLTQAISQAGNNTEALLVRVLGSVQGLAVGLLRGTFSFFIMLMLSAYLLITKDKILLFAKSLVTPGRHGDFETIVRRIDRGLGGVVRGQLLICVVNGVLSGIGFYLAGLPYWPLLTLIATVLSIIPIFGAFLSTVPAGIVALQVGPWQFAFVIGWVLLIHQIEANLLNPKIMGDAAKVHPVLVVFALLAGEHTFGILGALLAVPVLSIVQTFFLFFRERAMGVPASQSVDGLPSIPPPAPPPKV